MVLKVSEINSQWPYEGLLWCRSINFTITKEYSSSDWYLIDDSALSITDCLSPSRHWLRNQTITQVFQCLFRILIGNSVILNDIAWYGTICRVVSCQETLLFWAWHRVIRDNLSCCVVSRDSVILSMTSRDTEQSVVLCRVKRLCYTGQSVVLCRVKRLCYSPPRTSFVQEM